MTATTATTATVARAALMDYRGARYLRIEDLDGHRIARIRLNGRGTWAELRKHLAAHGYKIRGGFKYLSGADELRATLTRA